MKYSFFEKLEKRKIADKNYEEVEELVLKLSQELANGDVYVRNATDEDKKTFEAEFLAFEKSKQMAGFDEFVKSKQAELEAEFLASKE